MPRTHWLTPNDIPFLCKFGICSHFHFLNDCKSNCFPLSPACFSYCVEKLSYLMSMVLIRNNLLVRRVVFVISRKTEELCLNSLEELDICGFSVADCDFAFVKRLLGWTPVLKTVTINFDPSATLDEDLCKELLALSGPDTCMKIYLYCDGTKVMYTPVG